MNRKFAWVLLLTAAAQAAGVAGNWQGTLDVGAAKLRLAFHITKDSSGGYASKLDSIDQGASGISVQQTSVNGNSVHMEMPSLAATYEGTLKEDGSEIAGTFTQRGLALPLALKRVDVVETLKRPQNPKPPFPYDALDVSFENKRE